MTSSDQDFSPTAQSDALTFARRSRAAATWLRRSSDAVRQQILRSLAEALQQPEIRAQLLAANEADVVVATAKGRTGAFLDRLMLNSRRVEALVGSLQQVAELSDPVGRVESWRRLPSGIEVGRMSVPLGVLLFVFEARPSAFIEAVALAIRSGNAIILRGSSEARQTNELFARLTATALERAGAPSGCVQLVPLEDGGFFHRLLGCHEAIDVVIPRGGVDLIRTVRAHARMPVLCHAQGVCHLFVERTADLDQALALALNGKVQRPGVCNALEGILVDQAIAADFVPRLVVALIDAHVVVHACPRSLEHTKIRSPYLVPATEETWGREFLGLECALRVVSGFDAALEYIERYGSNHTESIATGDEPLAERFLTEVNASCVLVNASTRLNDGGELGLGAEIGISTTPFHAYGPMGLAELCVKKFVVRGSGQCRT